MAPRSRLYSYSVLSASKMQELDYSNDVIDSFRTAFSEATANSFEHACAIDSDVIKVMVEVSDAYTCFSIVNPKRRKFNIKGLLRKTSKEIEYNPRLRRGRGLLLISDLSDQLSSIEKDTGIKAVIERSRIAFDVNEIDGLVVLALLQGIHNASFSRRVMALIRMHSDKNVLLDFSRWRTAGSAVYFMTLEAESLLLQSKRKVVALLMPDQGNYVSPTRLPDELVVRHANVCTVFGRGRSAMQ